MPLGTVTAFDRLVGLGAVASEGRVFPFHATQIADGSRAIAVGTSVTFEVAFMSGGRIEAAGITPA